MMLTNRQRLFIFVGGLLGLIIAFLLLYMFVLAPKDAGQEPTPVTTDTGTTGTTTDVGQPGSTPDEALVPLSAEEQEKLYVKQLARIFTERFATYSNQNDNSHLDDVQDMVTVSMRNWIDSQTIDFGNSYYGVTTVVITNNIVSFDGNKAEVEIGAQQVISENGETRTENKTGTVNLEKVGENWLVSGLYWD